MIRVLLLIPSLGGGGAERQIPYLARGLRERGVDVHVGIFRGGPNLSLLEQTGATVHWIKSRGSYDPRMLPRIVRLIRRVQPDLVQTFLTQMDVVGGAAAWITGTRWVASERSAGDHYPRDLRHALRRMIGRRADAVIANSNGGLSFWSASRATKYVVPNALPLEHLDAVPREEIDAGDAKVILFAARLEAEKNLTNLIDAFAMAMRGRNAIAMLCGAGPEEADVRARIEARGLSDRVRLEGYTTRLWGLMKRADLFVSMSWFEGQSNAVLEAAACGCPLVLSDIGAHREIFDEQSAAFAPPSDGNAIAAAIARVLDDPEAARARARRAREIVSRFSVSALAEAYLRVYERTIANEHAIEVRT